MRMDWGRTLRPTITVAPLAVSPDMDSKIAPTGDKCKVSASAKGSAPNNPSTVQNREEIRKPSRILSSCLTFRTGNHIRKPEKKVMPIADKKLVALLLFSKHASIKGNIWMELNSIRRIPRIRNETEKCMV